jgi:pimeloyl-ACP methyl ester carboxylesterase
LRLKKIDPKDPLFALLVRNRDYFFHAFINDPLQVIRGVEVPVLIVQGEKDAQIDGVSGSPQYLAETLKRQYHGDATMQLLPEMDHWLRRPKAGRGFSGGGAGNRTRWILR